MRKIGSRRGAQMYCCIECNALVDSPTKRLRRPGQPFYFPVCDRDHFVRPVRGPVRKFLTAFAVTFLSYVLFGVTTILVDRYLPYNDLGNITDPGTLFGKAFLLWYGLLCAQALRYVQRGYGYSMQPEPTRSMAKAEFASAAGIIACFVWTWYLRNVL